MNAPQSNDLVVSVQDGIFVCTDGAGRFTRPATGDEQLLWAEIVRLRTEHEEDLARMERATEAVERLTRENIKLATALRYYSVQDENGAMARTALGLPDPLTALDESHG